MSNDHRTFLGEDRVSGDVIEMVVGVDDKFDGEFGDDANFAEQGLCGGRVIEGVDDCDAVVADDEACVSAGFTFGVINGGVHTVAEIFQSEGKSGVCGGSCKRRPGRGAGRARGGSLWPSTSCSTRSTRKSRIKWNTSPSSRC